ncbi:superoxide dismutase [Candidatus Micrarchaeota archaeon]|nr:superoxide dismutase [Candidatus Micrarchaeota archaeon]
MKYKSVPGLTERQISEHHDVLYAGYVKKLNEIESRLEGLDVSDANATYSGIRELKVEETFAKNAIKLHESYFDNMGGNLPPKGTRIAKLIERDFASLETWEKEFRALGVASRGWVVLAWDWDDGKLFNYLCDVHNQGGVWNCTPLLVLDVYEHAYFIDYGTKRKDYIEAFMKTIDWKHVNELVEKYRIE